MPLCCWTGEPCDCKTFPYKIDGLIPNSCHQRMDYGLIAVRSVNSQMKALGKEMEAAVNNKKFDPKDEAQVKMWEQKLLAVKKTA